MRLFALNKQKCVYSWVEVILLAFTRCQANKISHTKFKTNWFFFQLIVFIQWIIYFIYFFLIFISLKFQLRNRFISFNSECIRIKRCLFEIYFNFAIAYIHTICQYCEDVASTPVAQFAVKIICFWICFDINIFSVYPRRFSLFQSLFQNKSNYSKCLYDTFDGEKCFIFNKNKLNEHFY